MKKDFLTYQAQTTPHPLAMEVAQASGSYIYDTSGKRYLDFVAGVSACSLGHSHPKVKQAITQQLDKYMHVMVYGEYAQEKPIALAKLLAQHLPKELDSTYFVNSGTEAIDGAIKLARRVTGRTAIIAARDAYHGNSYGALSLMSHEERKAPFMPGIGDVSFIQFNDEASIAKITTKTAGVVLETIQGGAGFIEPTNNFLTKIKLQCQKVGALLILDEIQPGIGRTGKLFGFEHYNVVPDIVVTGKGLGGGMPIGAFTASRERMNLLSNNPKLGHITTFGGHPVIAAAALATLQEITQSNLMQEALEKEKIIRTLLIHPLISEIRGRGLMIAVLLPTAEIASQVILACQNKELILFWLLFESRAIRITPPLTISIEEIKEGCKIILETLDNI